MVATIAPDTIVWLCGVTFILFLSRGYREAMIYSFGKTAAKAAMYAMTATKMTKAEVCSHH
jgi:hypothetical protein